MTTIRTTLRTTRDSAQLTRSQSFNAITATNVQGALKELDAEIATKLTAVGNARLPASAANVPILTTDIEVGIDTSATAVATPLPSAAAWAAANPNGLELTIFDHTGSGAARNITPSLNGADTWVQGVAPVIASNFGLLKLRPMGSPVNSWYVRAIN